MPLLCLHSCIECLVQIAITSTTNGDPVLPGGLFINDTDIAWDTDTGKRIGHYRPQNLNTDPASRGGQTVNGYLNEDQHFAVWMRIAQLSNFRKLYGRIDSGPLLPLHGPGPPL